MQVVDCFGCGRRLQITPKRRHKLKNGNKIYCSTSCYRKSKGYVTGGHVGTCKTCRKEFVSRIAGKIYCDYKCYHKDPETIKRLRKMSPVAIAKMCEKRGITDFGNEIVLCAYCGGEVKIKKSRMKLTKRFFCNKVHYRKYLADRFDRWIASPQAVSLPHNYDEYMTQNKLPCPVVGCGWQGLFLSAHVNIEHGIDARTFKKMVGFNLTTGLVAPEVSLKMSRSAKNRGSNSLPPRLSGQLSEKEDYISLERREHSSKAKIMRQSEVGPKRICAGCGKKFHQSSVYGKTKFCTVLCRQNHYSREAVKKAKKRIRMPNGTFRWERT